MAVLDAIYAKARENPQKVVFPEGENEKIMQAAYEAGEEQLIVPILVGNAEKLKSIAAERGYHEEVFTFIDIDDERYKMELIRKYLRLLPGDLLML